MNRAPLCFQFFGQHGGGCGLSRAGRTGQSEQADIVQGENLLRQCFEGAFKRRVPRAHQFRQFRFLQIIRYCNNIHSISPLF